MKGIIISGLLLTAALLFVVWSGTVTEESLTDLLKKIEDLPNEPTEDTVELLNEIESEWNEKKELYSAISRFDFVYNFLREINAAKAGAEANDPGTYLAAKKGLINVLEYIRDIQRVRLDNII